MLLLGLGGNMAWWMRPKVEKSSKRMSVFQKSDKNIYIDWMRFVKYSN